MHQAMFATLASRAAYASFLFFLLHGNVFTIPVQAQVQWAQGFGSTGMDRLGRTAATPDGGAYYVMSSAGTLWAYPPSTPLDVVPGDDAIIKLNPDGQPVWAVGFAVRSFTSVAVAPDGSVVAIGEMEGDADMDPGPGEAFLSCSAECGFIVALSPAGSYLWSGNITATELMLPMDIVCAQNGIITLTGWCKGSLDLDPGTATAPYSVPTDGMFLLTLGADGAFIRAHTGTGSARPTSLAITPEGHVLCSGTLSGSIDMQPGPATFFITPEPSAFDDLFLVKWDTDGDVMWARLFEGEQDVEDSEVGLSPNGSVYLCGIFDGTLDLDPGAPEVVVPVTPGRQEIFVVKMNMYGTYNWSRHFAVEQQSSVCMSVDDQGDVYLGGTVHGVADLLGFPVGTPNVREAYLFCLRSNGTPAWVRSARTEGPFMGSAGIGQMDASVPGHVLVAGWFSHMTTVFLPNDENPSDGWYLEGSGSSDVFLAKYRTEIPQATTPLPATQDAPRLWPQPASDFVVVDLGNTMHGKADVWIHSMEGRAVAHYPQVDPSLPFQLDLASLPQGAYVLHLLSRGRAESMPLLRQ